MVQEFPQLLVIQQIGRTYRAMLAAFDAGIGQPMPRWRVLLMLHELGETSQKELACRLRMDPAALTRQVKTIERMGWVERHADVHDNRLINVALTPDGRALVRETLPRRSAFMRDVLSDLSVDEMSELGRMLDVLERRLKKRMAQPPAPPSHRRKPRDGDPGHKARDTDSGREPRDTDSNH